MGKLMSGFGKREKKSILGLRIVTKITLIIITEMRHRKYKYPIFIIFRPFFS